MKDSGQTQAEVSIGPGQCDFTVQAVLHIGSTIPAHITVPQRDDGGEQQLKLLLSLCVCLLEIWCKGEMKSVGGGFPSS